MSVQNVLNEDWSAIDNRKTRYEDRGFVSCEEVFEVEYLIDVFKKHYPAYTEKDVIYAIAAACRALPGPQPRQRFIEYVGARLSAVIRSGELVYPN